VKFVDIRKAASIATITNWSDANTITITYSCGQKQATPGSDKLISATDHSSAEYGISRPESKFGMKIFEMLIASWGEAPEPPPEALPLDPIGGTAPDSHYRLALPRSPWTTAFGYFFIYDGISGYMLAWLATKQAEGNTGGRRHEP
jgi:hypothetical protein